MDLDCAATHSAAATATWLFALTAVLTFPVLFFLAAPYGKLYTPSWGRALPGCLSWFVQEGLSPVFLLLAYAHTSSVCATPPSPAATPFIALWCLHYLNRAVVYPLRRSMGPTTLSVVLAAVAFNVVNGAIAGAELAGQPFALRHPSTASLAAPTPLAGLALMALGAAVNLYHDALLRSLRKPGQTTGHKLPRGGLFELVACPPYLGEWMEWSGWALATGTSSGAAFALWTVANLLPRAWATRRWYREKFGSDPHARRIGCMVPFLF